MLCPPFVFNDVPSYLKARIKSFEDLGSEFLRDRLFCDIQHCSMHGFVDVRLLRFDYFAPHASSALHVLLASKHRRGFIPPRYVGTAVLRFMSYDGHGCDWSRRWAQWFKDCHRDEIDRELYKQPDHDYWHHKANAVHQVLSKLLNQQYDTPRWKDRVQLVVHHDNMGHYDGIYHWITTISMRFLIGSHEEPDHCEQLHPIRWAKRRAVDDSCE